MPGQDIAAPVSPFGAAPQAAQAGAPQAGAPAPMSGGGVGDVRAQQLNTIVQMMLQRMKPQKQLSQPRPGAGYGPDQLAQEGYIGGVQGSKMGEIGAGLANIGTAVHNAVAQNKEKQVRTAMADWSTLQQRWDNALAVSGGDEQKAQQLFEQDPYTQAVLGDPKKMKNIAKAYSVDYLKPEKTTVYGEALKRHGEVTKARGKIDLLKKIMTLGRAGRQQPPQLSPEQQQQMVHEQASKLPFTHTQADPQKTAEFLEKMREFDTRDKEAQARIAETHERTQATISYNTERIRQIDEQLADTKLDKAERRRLEAARVGIAAENAQNQKLATWGRLAQE